MFFEYRQNKKLLESYEQISVNETLPPGFEFGDEVVNLNKLPIKDSGSIEEDTPVNPQAEPLPTKNKGTPADLDRIIKSKFPEPEKIKDIAQGIRQLRLSGNISSQAKQNHITALKALGMGDQEAEDFFNQQVDKAKKAFPKKKETNPDLLAKGAERLQRLIHNSVVLQIVTDDGTRISGEKFKNLINVIPDRIISNNAKIDKSGGEEERFYEITLPAYQGLYYDNKENIFRLLRTCPSAGECKLYCYATKGGYVQYEGTNLRQIKILNYLMNDWKGFKNKVMKELADAQKSDPKVKLRWHDSGDFFVDSYVELAFDVARSTPDVTHYAYTKSVGLVRKYESSRPDNFVFNFSEGGLQDKKIKDTDKNSKVIPKVIWKDLFNAKDDFKDEEKLQELKPRIAEVYGAKGITVENILTYEELMNTPEGNEPRWHVIVTPKDGDDSASRKDVISTLLLAH